MARMTQTHAHESDPVENFIEEMGLISQDDGKPRIAGRIYGLLFIEGGPRSLVEMAERLQVSRASVSTNARMLADAGLLRRTSQPGDRQDYYELAANPHRRILDSRSERMRKAADRIAEASTMFGDSNAEMGERVRRLARLYNQYASFIDDWADRIESEEFSFPGPVNRQGTDKP